MCKFKCCRQKPILENGALSQCKSRPVIFTVGWCLQDHIEPKRLEFLPYHFLLASVGEPGVLTYQVTPTAMSCTACCTPTHITNSNAATAARPRCTVPGQETATRVLDHSPACSAAQTEVQRLSCCGCVPQDTSTGQLVAQHRSRLGPCGVLAQNPWNAVLQLGHANGTVTMWTPNLSTPVVRLLAHRVGHIT